MILIILFVCVYLSVIYIRFIFNRKYISKSMFHFSGCNKHAISPYFIACGALCCWCVLFFLLFLVFPFDTNGNRFDRRLPFSNTLCLCFNQRFIHIWQRENMHTQKGNRPCAMRATTWHATNEITKCARERDRDRECEQFERDEQMSKIGKTQHETNKEKKKNLKQYHESKWTVGQPKLNKSYYRIRINRSIYEA